MPVTVNPAFSDTARGNVCSVCGWHQRAVDEADPNGPKERVVDTGVFIDHEGTFEVCETCIVEMAHAVGMIEEATATGLKMEASALRSRATKAENALAKAKDAFAASAAAFAPAPAPAAGSKK